MSQLNYLDDGVIWRTAGQHSVIRRGIDRIYGQPRSTGSLSAPGGHDWWSIAASQRFILIPDSFQEQLYVFDDSRRLVGTITSASIGQTLAAAGVNVERSGGPPGVRDAVAHPDGGWVVLIAGPGSDALLRVLPDLTLSVLSSSFGQAMNRGDEIQNFPRLAVGGSPPAILVTVRSPQRGIAVVGLDGTLIHTIPLGQLYHGIAVVPGTSRMFLLRSDGVVERYDDFYNSALGPVPFSSLPAGVSGRDLAYNSRWHTRVPNLVAVGSDGLVYSIDLSTGQTRPVERDGLRGVLAVDFESLLGVFARDESAWLDGGSE